MSHFRLNEELRTVFDGSRVLLGSVLQQRGRYNELDPKDYAGCFLAEFENKIREWVRNTSNRLVP